VHAGGAHVGGAHVHAGGVHAGGVHHGGIHYGGGSYYNGGGLYRGGLYGLGGYGLSLGFGNYGYGSSYYGGGNYYPSSSGYYLNSAPLLAPSNVGSAQVISLYPSTSDLPAPTLNRPALNANDGTGTIVVRTPANAEVFWNGTPTIAGGAERLFGTLPLNAEGVIHRFEARWTNANGQTVTQSRDVRALPNQTVLVDFTAPAAAPANPAPANPAPAPAPAIPMPRVNEGVPALPPVPDLFK